MSRSFDKKPKKSLKPSQRHVSMGIPTNIAVGPLGFQAELDIDSRDDEDSRASRIVFRDKKSEDQGSAVTDVLATGSVVKSNEQGGDSTKENTCETGKGKDEQAEASSVPERDDKDTGHRAVPILVDISKESASGFGSLKAVLNTFSTVDTNHEETFAVRNNIQVLLSRITTLNTLFATPPGNVEEQRRRDELIRKFKGIEIKLRSLTDNPELRGLAGRGGDDREASGLLEDLQEAIFDYQTIQQMELYKRGCKSIDTVEASALKDIRCAWEAEYWHGDRKGCLKGTRGAILDGIERWARNFDKPPVYWLNGLAGTGKTTIAQTTAERIFSDGKLGASFFCSRDFSDRSDLRFIFPTLAVQLARRYTEFRSVLVPLVQSDPGIARGSLCSQMKELIVNPLIESDISTVIIIDALDECKDEEPASAILSVLGQFVSEIPKVKFFVTGRPERRIREGFRLPLLAEATDVFVLHDVEPSLIGNDIRRFLSRSLEIAGRQCGLDGWPTKEQLDLLCERAAGLFAYAVATVKFVDHRNNDPKEQLDRLLRSPESSALEGKAALRGNTTLDSLYASILREAFGSDDPEDDPKVRSVLGAVILAVDPLSPFAIATLLGLSAESVFRRLSSVHSLLILQDLNQPVRPFHKSFPDFIVDPIRCINDRFRVSPPGQHLELLVGCLELMNRKLEKNMCNLPDAVTNSEVGDLQERNERYIDPTLQYACKSWHRHLVDEHTVRMPKVVSTLHRFLEKKFLFWLEILSILGTTREAVDALDVVARWLEESPTLDLVIDCFRFVTRFFEIINKSAPHIYHSALLLSPQKSIVRKLYEPYARPLTRIVQGLPTSWDPSITVKKPSDVFAVTWSPCSRFIAFGDGTLIEILDAATLDQHATFYSPSTSIKTLIFSPDCRLLTLVYDRNFKMHIINWDIQTGAPVSTISSEVQVSALTPLSLAFSACGTVLGVFFPRYYISTIHIYNVLSGKHIRSHSVGSDFCEIWAHGERLRFATLRSGSITTWEAGFASEHPLTEVESLPTPHNFDPSHGFLLLPTHSRLAFFLEGVAVWDTQHSKFLLNFAEVEVFEWMTFSSDGRFFACATLRPEVYLWKESPTGYVLHHKFVPSTGGSGSPRLSPNGQSIVTSSFDTLRLWRTEDSATTLSIPTPAFPHTKPFILEFSPDKLLTATARMADDTATVFDLKSGVPRLIIDTGMEIYGLGVAGNNIVVVDKEKSVSWDLPPGDHVLDVRVNVSDSVRTKNFDHPLARGLVPPVSISPDLKYIAVVERQEWPDSGLNIYDVATGKRLASAEAQGPVHMSWFTPDGREVWCYPVYFENSRGWAIVRDSESSFHKLKGLELAQHPQGGYPWEPSHNCKVTDDGWILGSSEKRLLWLPPHWQSGDKRSRVWDGRYLGLLDPGLREVVVLEVLEE